MKRFLVIIALLPTLLPLSSHAQQQYVGVKGGWGLADVRLYPHWTTPPVWGKWNGGIYWVYYGGGKQNEYLYDEYTGGISIEAEFMQRGFEYAALDRDSDRYTYGRSINSIVVPFMWQPHVLALDNRLRIFLNAGLTFSYNIDSKEYYIDKQTGTVETTDYEMQLVRDNSFGYGLCGGLGVGWSWNHLELMMEGRYYFGYSDIVKRKTVYSETQFLRSPLDNINVSIGIAYRWTPKSSRKPKVAADNNSAPTKIIIEQ